MKNKSKRIKRRILIITALLVVLVLSIMLYLNHIVNPVIITMSESKVRSLAQKAVGNAIYEIIRDDDLYDKLITISRDEKGEIVMLSSNSIQINMLARELSRSAQLKLESIGEHGIDIPIGSFSGMPIFVGRGPSIAIKILPIGSISSNFISEFTSAGINQTNHKIYLNVVSYVSVILPTANKIVETTTQMMLCESIIIGAVPITYLQANELGDMMDLVPN